MTSIAEIFPFEHIACEKPVPHEQSHSSVMPLRLKLVANFWVMIDEDLDSRSVSFFFVDEHATNDKKHNAHSVCFNMDYLKKY